MEFKEEYIPGIKTPILAPKTVRILGVKDDKIGYLDYLDNREYWDEVHFYHGKNQVILNRFRVFFPLDAVLIMLFSPSGNLYIQRRGKNTKWEPGKLDLVGVAGAINARLEKDIFISETGEEAAMREIVEETGLGMDELPKDKLVFLSDYFNKYNNIYQKVYVYQLTYPLSYLKESISRARDKADDWIEKGYTETLDEYFGSGVGDYAGGEELRPYNFISDHKIKKLLDDYHQSLHKN